MIVAAAVVLLSSGFSCYTHGKTDQDADMDTKVRRDTLQSLANASALLSNLRDFLPPLLTPSSIICCPSSVLQEVTGTSAGAEIRLFYGWNFLAEQVHLSFVVAGGWVDCGGSFSLLNLVAG